jgi:uncharacterized protein YqeY
MKIIEEITRRLKLAMLNRDASRRDVLRFVKGKLDLMKPNLPDTEVARVIRGLIKEGNEIPTMFTEVEMAELKDLIKWSIDSGVIPVMLSREQILGVLKETPEIIDQIRLATDENKAMGPAMRVLKSKGVDSEDVRAVIQSIRG